MYDKAQGVEKTLRVGLEIVDILGSQLGTQREDVLQPLGVRSFVLGLLPQIKASRAQKAKIIP